MTLRPLAAVATTLMLLAAGAVQAQAMPQEPRNFYFTLFGGLTGGGDKLAEVRFSDGSRQSVNGGGLVHFGAGLTWQPQDTPFMLQSTIGYHVDNVTASNGDVTFSRVPIEVLGFYTGVPRWRFGGGARFVSSIELSSDVNGFSDSIKFKDTTGAVFEAGYQLAPKVWLNGRYTAEKYEAASVNGLSVISTGQTSGNSIGINLVVSL